jgi:hypothetical protein
LAVSLPSAFKLFISLNDYRGAQQVAELCPNAFDTPGLKGWRFAVRGFLEPDVAAEMFSNAADAFADDVPPRPEEKLKRHWTSINIDLGLNISARGRRLRAPWPNAIE